jgi:phage gp29-like protein
MSKHTSPVTLGRRIAGANTWRDNYNPQRGLTIQRAVTLCESYTRGEYADLMWLFGAPFTGIESSDADYMALIDSRISVLLEMDWAAKPVALPDQADPALTKLAEAQSEYIRSLVDAIANLYEAIEHLSMATFRGFAHCEIITNADGDTTELRPIDQWHIVRQGTKGPWRYNPRADQTTWQSLGSEMDIDPRHFIVREVKRPVGRIALLKYIRQNLSQKDWDAFIEIYGLPGGMVIMPQEIPEGREDEYRAAAEEAARGGSGALPHGSTYTTNDSPRGINPFRDHMKWLQEQLVLAGTGGKLTMLAESGSGTLAGQAHSETFTRIARADARKISEAIQRQFIEPRLQEKFPGQPVLAWFELAFNEETDTGEFIKDVSVLAAAGLQVDPAQITEKTGYRVTATPAANPPAGNWLTNARKPSTRVNTRKTPENDSSMGLRRSSKGSDPTPASGYLAQARKTLETAPTGALAPLQDQIDTLLAETDENTLRSGLEKLLSELPGILHGDDTLTAAWEDILTTALLEGTAIHP